MRSLPVIPVLPHERLICLDYIYRPLHLSNFLNQQPIVANSCQVKAELVGELRGYPTPQASGLPGESVQVASGAPGRSPGAGHGVACCEAASAAE